MRILFTFFVLMTIGLSGQADIGGMPSAYKPGDPCYACLNGRVPELPVRKIVKEEPKAALDLSEQEVGRMIYDLMLRRQYITKGNPRCANFAGSEGFGSWGKHLLSTLTPASHPHLFAGPEDLRKYCPKYETLNDNAKKAVLILILGSMTFYESSCNYRQVNGNATNGYAIGLLQLHRHKEHHYYKGGTCRRGDGADAKKSLACGASMLEILTERQDALFSRRSYWEVLRPQGRSKKAREIIRNLKNFPLCQ